MDGETKTVESFSVTTGRDGFYKITFDRSFQVTHTANITIVPPNRRYHVQTAALASYHVADLTKHTFNKNTKINYAQRQFWRRYHNGKLRHGGQMKTAIVINGYYSSPAYTHQVDRITEELRREGYEPQIFKNNNLLLPKQSFDFDCAIFWIRI